MKHELLHYFQGHLIHVVTPHGLGEIIGNHLDTGRIAMWALKIMRLHIMYVPQTAIKSQALADFVAEWTETQQPPTIVTREHWSMYFHDSFTLNEVGGKRHSNLSQGRSTHLRDSTTFSHSKQCGGI
jgi:hypothetical protein